MIGIHIDRDGFWCIQGDDVTRSLEVKHPSCIQSTKGLYGDDYDIVARTSIDSQGSESKFAPWMWYR